MQIEKDQLGATTLRVNIFGQSILNANSPPGRKRKPILEQVLLVAWEITGGKKKIYFNSYIFILWLSLSLTSHYGFLFKALT